MTFLVSTTLNFSDFSQEFKIANKKSKLAAELTDQPLLTTC